MHTSLIYKSLLSHFADEDMWGLENLNSLLKSLSEHIVDGTQDLPNSKVLLLNLFSNVPN